MIRVYYLTSEDKYVYVIAEITLHKII